MKQKPKWEIVSLGKKSMLVRTTKRMEAGIFLIPSGFLVDISSSLTKTVKQKVFTKLKDAVAFADKHIK